MPDLGNGTVFSKGYGIKQPYFASYRLYANPSVTIAIVIQIANSNNTTFYLSVALSKLRLQVSNVANFFSLWLLLQGANAFLPSGWNLSLRL